MKKIAFIFLTSLLTTAAFSQSTFYVSAENGLFTREKPNQGSKAIAKLNYGTRVDLIENTNLNLDVLDKDKKISGQWVRVTARVPYDQVEGYVFNGYLSDKALEPRSIVKFNDLQVTIFDLEIWNYNNKIQKKVIDKARFDIELGSTPENKVLKLNPAQGYKKIEVYQAYETSVTIMNEGPHCDLIDWDHYQSVWLPMEKIGKNIFKSLTYSEKDWNRFVTTDLNELKTAVQNYCGDTYANLVTQISTVKDYPSSVSISKIYFKIVMTDRDNNRVTKIISFDIPMGC